LGFPDDASLTWVRFAFLIISSVLHSRPMLVCPLREGFSVTD
jgi:hypothetical protein